MIIPGSVEGCDGPESQNESKVVHPESKQSNGQFGHRVRTSNQLPKRKDNEPATPVTDPTLLTVDGPVTVLCHWQWEHRTGFRNYDEKATQRIEDAYQHGQTHVRLKSGKIGSTPMELFLIDMVQYDPITGSHRKIRRVGPDSWWGPISRTFRGYLTSWETGKPRKVRFREFTSQRLTKQAPGTSLAKAKGLASMCSHFELMKGEGICTRLCTSSWFFPLSMLVVVLNTIYIGIDADHNPHDAVIYTTFSWYTIVENVFCIFFAAELSVRFGAFKVKRECIQDHWFVFDAVLALMMLGETWIMPLVLYASSSDSSDGPGVKEYSILRIARLLRLSRLGRIVRILRVFPEVMTLLKGIAAAMRSVFFTLLLLLILLFVFGILFKTQSDNTILEDIFSTVSRSMWILLLRGTFLDSPTLILDQIAAPSPALAGVFLIFIFMSSFTVMNMLIGILCDVVYQVSALEKEQASISYLKTTLFELLECFDKDDDRQIHPDEFELLMQNPELNLILKNFGVDCLDLMSLKDVLFEDKQVSSQMTSSVDDTTSTVCSASLVGDASFKKATRKLTFDEFVEVVVRLRGGNSATVMDVVELRELVNLKFERVEKMFQLQENANRSAPNLPRSDAKDEPLGTLLQKQDTWQRDVEAKQSAWQERIEQRLEKIEQKHEVRHADLLDKLGFMQQAQQQILDQVLHLDRPAAESEAVT